MINLLRISRSSSVITADVFERNFKACLSSRVNFLEKKLDQWLPSIFGQPNNLHDYPTCCKCFESATADISFFSPNWEMIQLIPLLLQLRNQSGSSARLLLIAHSPAGYVQEWLQLRAVMVPGDVIVAPSQNARAIIGFLCPDLEPFVHVIPHPIRPMPKVEEKQDPGDGTIRMMSLGRISPHKLIHRQIEAVHLLKKRGHHPLLDVVGPLKDPDSDQFHPYALSLIAKINRLQLKENVSLKGAVYDETEKAALISNAQMMLNLSVTIEESFGKSPAEALGQGIPVITTQWNGLPETIGDGGRTIPVLVDDSYNADISVESLADAILGIAADPPSRDQCLLQAKTFSPHRIGGRYFDLLKSKLEMVKELSHWPDPTTLNHQPLAPKQGILASSAPLLAFSLADAFALQWKHRADMLRVFSNGPMFPNDEFHLRSLIVTCAQHYIALCMTGKTDRLPTPDSTGVMSHGHFPEGTSLPQRMKRALTLKGADPLSKVITIQFLRSFGLLDAEIFSTEKMGHIEDCGGKKFVFLEMLLFEKRYEQAFQTAQKNLKPDSMDEIDFLQIRQFGRICRLSGDPAPALPWMKRWLDSYPDHYNSGSLWLDYFLTSLKSDQIEIARQALCKAELLLGKTTVTGKARGMLERAANGSPTA